MGTSIDVVSIVNQLLNEIREGRLTDAAGFVKAGGFVPFLRPAANAPRPLPLHVPEFVKRFGFGVDQYGIRSGSRVRVCTGEGLFLPPTGDQRLGPRDDHES